MKKLKNNLIICIVFCAVFSLLSTGIMQPIQTAQAQTAKTNSSIDDAKLVAALSELSIDIQQESDSYIITIGNTTITMDVIENGYRVNTFLDNEIITCDITIENRANSEISPGKATKNSEAVQNIVMLNGTEINKALDNFKPSQPIEYPYELPQTRGAYYWWDNVYFKENYQVPYPHPDKEHYEFGPFQDWFIIGTDLVHYQFEHTTSQFLLEGSAFFQGFILGAMCGSLILPGIGTLIGGLIGGALEAIYSWLYHKTYLDEDDCLWVWFDKYTPGALEGHPYYLYSRDTPLCFVLTV